MDNLGFIRVNRNDTQVKMVKQMPKVQKSQQPTIAIITAQYCEKLAVDAMIEDKDTYVKYKTEGEQNIQMKQVNPSGDNLITIYL